MKESFQLCVRIKKDGKHKEGNIAATTQSTTLLRNNLRKKKGISKSTITFLAKAVQKGEYATNGRYSQ